MKTLKDIKEAFVATNLLEQSFEEVTSEVFVSKNKLRLVAKEWIKQLEKKRYNVPIDIWLRIGYQIDWIEHFFNLEDKE